MSLLAMLVGGAAGAVLRYQAERALRLRHGLLSRWVPAFGVDLSGCFLLGLLTGTAVARDLSSVTVLLAGAITAFSVCGYETVRLAQSGARAQAGLAAVAGWFVGTAAAAAGVVVSMR